jgi:nucleoside-diphosphate-sugar epimerase
MTLLVTGAGGRLGRVLCRLLQDAGMAVRGLDIRADDAGDPPVQAVNLLDPAATRAAVDGADGVVHLANHTSSYYGADGQQVFRENAAMNFSVFEAAGDMGVRQVIFASSVQAFRSERQLRDHAPSRLPRLPLDGELPAAPTNPYALSKAVGEDQLRYLVRTRNIAGVALRLPMLLPHPPSPQWTLNPDVFLDEAFSWLTYEDAARCIVALVRRRAPGYRTYFPAHPRPWIGGDVEDLRRLHFPDVPCASLPLASFVDNGALARDVDWRPSAAFDR